MVAMDQGQIFTSQCPLHGLVVVKDSLEADGNFLIPYTLKEALSNGFKVSPDAVLVRQAMLYLFALHFEAPNNICQAPLTR